MAKRFFLMIATVIVVVAVIGFIKVRQIQAAIAMGAMFAPPPAAVSTYEITAQKWQPVLSAVGTADAVNGVMVATDLPGIVREIDFESGKPVKAGTVLVKLDTTQEDALLNAAKARMDLAKINLDRNGELLKKRVASQSDYDSAGAEFKQATAAVREIEALIQRKSIRAPFDGLLGIREVNLGQYLQSGDEVVPLQSLDPIYVNFSLPQQNLADLAEGRTVEVTADGLPGIKFTGKITAIDPNVDARTRNVRVQATLANPDGKLRSGMFVNTALLLPTRDEVIAIPASAVNYAPYGDSVFVVEPMTGEDGKEYTGVRQKFVKLGTTRGDLVEVVTGLEAGQQIVSGGTFKLQDKAPVNVNNDFQPGVDPAPTPAES